MMEDNLSINKALEDSNQDELLLRLYLYTRNRLSRMFWRGEHKGPIPGGWEAEDFIQAAIKKALNKDRAWKSQERSLFDFLTDIISSDINHRAEKLENQIEHRVTTARSESNNNAVCIVDIPGQRSDWPDARSLKEQENYEREIIQSHVGENPIDRAVIKCVIQDGLARSAEIATELGVPVSEVYKSKRRLRRKYQHLRAKSHDALIGKRA